MYKACNEILLENTHKAMANREPSAFKDCRYCGKTFAAWGVISHETRYCSRRPPTPSTSDPQPTANDTRKPHIRIIDDIINARLTTRNI